MRKKNATFCLSRKVIELLETLAESEGLSKSACLARVITIAARDSKPFDPAEQ